MLLSSLPSWQRIFGFAVVLLLAALLRTLINVADVESSWRDVEFRWLAQHAPLPVEDNLVIVGIDDADMRVFEVPVAILHRQIGTFLEAVASAKPRVIGVDVLLPSHSFDRWQPGLDAALARGMVVAKKSAPLVLGISTDELGLPRYLHAPFAALAGKDGLGFVLLVRDTDGTVRRFDERLGTAKEPVPTLVGQMARALGIDPQPGWIHFALGAPFRYVPLREVLAWQTLGDWKKLRQTFGGKVVFLGSTLTFDDIHRSPVPLAQWNPDAFTSSGVLFHAQALRSLMNGRMVQPLPDVIQWCLLALLACTWWLRPCVVSWATMAGGVVCLAVASIILLRESWALDVVAMTSTLLLGIGARTGTMAWLVGKERKRLRDTFAGFVSPGVLSEILSGRLVPQLGGERLDVCVLFSDIRGFTRLSESLEPGVVTHLLNRYFERMIVLVHEHNGTLDKLMGDGLMAIFGAPRPSSNPCEDAFQTARAMLSVLETFNAEQIERGEPVLHIGIGLHVGPAIVGYVGSKDRHEYSAIGDTVNVASRMEDLTKTVLCPLVVSKAVQEHLNRPEDVVALGLREIKGHSAMEVFGWQLVTKEETI